MPSVSLPGAPDEDHRVTRAANRAASAYPFATSGQVASTTCGPCSSAPARRGNPMRGERHDSPRRRRIGNHVEILDEHCSPVLGNSATTTVLCTICLRTYTLARSSSTADRLDSTPTPAQNDRGDRANSTATSPKRILCDRSHEHRYQHSRRDISVATTRSGLGLHRGSRK